MKNQSLFKRIALTAIIAVLVLGLSGCLVKPDTVDSLPTQPVQLDPFKQITPSPSPAPTPPVGEGQQQGGDGQQGTGGDTPGQVITPTPTVAIVTMAPTPTVAIVTAAPPTPSPTPITYRNGDSGDGVKNVQQRLKHYGYYTGSVDGVFGKGTESALKEFQQRNGLQADGIAGAKTLAALNGSSAKSKPKATATVKPTTDSSKATSKPRPGSYTPSSPGTGGYGYLQLGSGGTAVRKLQQRLKDLGYFSGAVNGNFGSDTETAVIAFQERNGQWADGVAGPDTQIALYSSDALAARK